MTARFLSVTEVAKLIRRDLKQMFPHTKFSVRSEKYAGGSSIDIRWVDGPAEKVVGRLVGYYRGKDFDGSIDLATRRYHWLLPDGSLVLARIDGTTGARGTIEDYRRIAPHDDAELVSLGGDYIFTTRELSAARLEALALDTAHEWGVPVELVTVHVSDDGTGYLDMASANHWVPNAHERFGALVHRRLADEERAELEAWEARQEMEQAA